MNYKIKFLDGSTKEFDSLRGANLVGANLSHAYLLDTDLSGSNLSGADLSGADLSRAYLSRADLRGANLRGAYLGGANLGGANLRGTNLRCADLRGTDSFNTNILTFQFGKHFGFYHEGYLKIGCQGHSLEYWISNVETIGRRNRYTPQEIALYKAQINLIKEHYASKN